MKAVDYERLSGELVRALRGRRSQRALGRRLQFTSNVIYAWESGRRHPAASVFFKLAARARPDIAERLYQALWSDRRGTAKLTTPAGISTFVRELTHGHAVSAIARSLGVDRTTVMRWTKGKSEPRLPELLKLIEVTTLRLLDVLELITDPQALASIRQQHSGLQAQRRLAFEMPFSHAVLRALELRDRARAPDDATFVAARTGTSLELAENMLAELLTAGQIQKRKGRYRLPAIMAVDTRVDNARNLHLKRYWSQLALDRMDGERLANQALASYNLFAASHDAFQRIRKLQLEYYDEVRQIVANDREPDRVVLMNVQLFPLDA